MAAWTQPKLPRELQLRPRTPLPLWLRDARDPRSFIDLDPRVETEQEARERGRRERKMQGKAEQIVLEWP